VQGVNELNAQQYITSPEAADLMRIKDNTLRIWRSKGKSPAYIRLGAAPQGRVLYRVETIREWLEEHTHLNTSEELAGGAQ
jgi:hypothetical protein